MPDPSSNTSAAGFFSSAHLIGAGIADTDTKKGPPYTPSSTRGAARREARGGYAQGGQGGLGLGSENHCAEEGRVFLDREDMDRVIQEAKAA